MKHCLYCDKVAGCNLKFSRLKLRSAKNTATDNAVFEYGEGRNPRTQVDGQWFPGSKITSWTPAHTIS